MSEYPQEAKDTIKRLNRRAQESESLVARLRREEKAREKVAYEKGRRMGAFDRLVMRMAQDRVRALEEELAKLKEQLDQSKEDQPEPPPNEEPYRDEFGRLCGRDEHWVRWDFY